MDDRLKQRLAGAAVLVSLAVIFVPMLLDGAREPTAGAAASAIPQRPQQNFAAPVIPLDPGLPPPQPMHAPEGGSAPGGEAPAPSEAKLAAVHEDAVTTGGPASARVEPKASGGWAVQLGSFAKAENADSLREQLRAKGYTVLLESVQSDDGPMTRVYVGPQAKREAAEQVRERLRGEVKLKGLVVRYPGG